MQKYRMLIDLLKLIWSAKFESVRRKKQEEKKVDLNLSSKMEKIVNNPGLQYLAEKVFWIWISKIWKFVLKSINGSVVVKFKEILHFEM